MVRIIMPSQEEAMDEPGADYDRHQHFDQAHRVWIAHTHLSGRHPHRHAGYSYAQPDGNR